MPATSRKQQRWAFAVKGPAWARKHHFDNKTIPKKKKSTHSTKRGRSFKRKKRRS